MRRKVQTNSTALLTLLVSIGVTTPAAAGEWDDIPELSRREHAAIRKRFDGPRYNDLRECLREFDSVVGADYYGVLVDVTEESGSRSREHDDAGAYAKRVFEAWAGDRRIDPDTDVVIAAGIRNRSVGVHVAERWRTIGFDETAQQRALKTVDFRRKFRRRQYIDAICSLAESIDYSLAALQQKRDRTIDRTKNRLAELESRHATVGSRLEETFDDEPFGETLSDALADVAKMLKGAKTDVEETPQRAAEIADEAAAQLTKISSRLDRYREAMEALTEIENELQALREDLKSRMETSVAPDRWSGPIRRLAECEERASLVRSTYEAEPESVLKCLRAVQPVVAALERDAFYEQTIIPAMLAGGGAVAFAWFLIARVRRRRRTLSVLEPELQDWELRVAQAKDRLVELRNAYPAYFDSQQRDWGGESAEVGQRAADAVNRAHLLHDEASEVFSEASKLREKTRFLGVRRLDKALRILRYHSVTLSGGVDPRQPVETSLSEPYQAPASRLRGDLQEAVRMAERNLERLGETLEKLDRATREATEAAQAARQAVQHRRSLGFESDHLDDALDTARDEFERARRLAEQDPVGALSAMRDAAERLEAVCRRAEEGNDAVRRILGPLSEGADEIESRMRELRLSGHELGEPGFAPRVELRDAARQAEWALEHVRRGREDEATAIVGDVTKKLDQLKRRLDVTAEASELLPTMLEAVGERREELKSALLNVRMRVQRLDEPSPDALSSQLDELTQIQSALSRLTDHLDDLKRALAQQHYLAVTADIRSMVQLCDRGAELVERIADTAGIEPPGDGYEWPTVWTASTLARWESAAFGSPPSKFGAMGGDDSPW